VQPLFSVTYARLEAVALSEAMCAIL